MEFVMPGAMLGALLALSALVLWGGRGLRPGERGESGSPGRWPPVALIVPVTGATQGLPAQLASLLAQDYPDYQVIFVTCSLKDPATPVILETMRGHPRARQVISGRAASCGQKNHNLLAGLRLLNDIPEILAFGDSNQLAPPEWLRELVRPIASGEADITSGYHHVIPGDARIATLGRAVTVLILYLMKGISWLDQPWGGATAIRRTVFEALQVGRCWADKVVDDVSLAARLRQAGISLKTVPGATLLTPIAGESLQGWEDWLTRQWLYLKFCLPGTWLAGGILVHGLVLLMMGAGWRVVSAPLWEASWGQGLTALAFLALVGGLGLALRTLHPAAGPRLAWLLGFFATLGMASWCHVKTWLAPVIRWRGTSYRVTWGGKVKEVQESQSQ